MTESRAELRQRFRHQRRALTPALRTEAESQICAHLRELLEQLPNGDTNPAVVAAYLAFDGEADLSRWFAETPHQIVLPRVSPHDSTMTFHPWAPGEELAANTYNINEPLASVPAVSHIDMVLTPCVAFDDSGRRLGMGGGYYDRFFAASPETTRVGVGFSVQRHKRPLPVEHWDVHLHAVVTEDGVLEFSAQS